LTPAPCGPKSGISFPQNRFSMRLRLTSASPFARKVRVTAHELGIAHQIELVTTTLRVPDPAFWEHNPLGRVPVLETGDGEALSDSYVICEYLCATHGGQHLLAPDGPARWRAMSLASMAGGMVEAGMAVRRERARAPQEADAAALAYESAKLARAFARIERDIARPMLEGSRPFEHAAIACACTLGWLELRLGAEFTFGGRADLHRWWLECVSPRESMQASVPH